MALTSAAATQTTSAVGFSLCCASYCVDFHRIVKELDSRRALAHNHAMPPVRLNADALLAPLWIIAVACSVIAGTMLYSILRIESAVADAQQAIEQVRQSMQQPRRTK